MFIRPMDMTCWEQMWKCSDDGGEIVVTGNKMLKVGMRGHCGCGALSRSRRLGASSLPLEPRLSVQPCVRPMQLQEPS